MESVLDKIAELTVFDFGKPTRKIPMREKHFNTAIVVLMGLVLSHVPLIYGTEPVQLENSMITFRVSGTLMQFGTQPFVFASMAYSLIFDKDENARARSRALGMVCSVLMCLRWTLWEEHHWFCGVQLMTVSVLLLQAMCYLDTRGSIHLSTALIFAQASERILTAVFSLSIVWAILLIAAVSWIETLVVTVPLTHLTRKSQTVSMPLPVMYNSTSSLVMYYTLVEMLAGVWPPLEILLQRDLNMNTLFAAIALLGGLYILNKQLPRVEEKTGRDLVRMWKKEHYTMKGWRDEKKIGRYIQKIIDRNVLWNTMILFSLWAVGVIFRPPISVTTLFILTSTAKEYVTQPITSLWK